MSDVSSDVCSSDLGRRYTPELAIQAGVAEFAAAAQALPPVAWEHRRAWVEAAHKAYLATLTPPETDKAFDPGKAMEQLREWLPKDAIVTVDAGSYSGWQIGRAPCRERVCHDV